MMKRTQLARLKELYSRLAPHIGVTQNVVAILVGIVTIVGAGYATYRYFNPLETTGRVEAVVQDNASGGPIAGAAVEILAKDNALVVALHADQHGRVGYTLKEGRYDVRVKQDGYYDATRGVQVMAGEKVDVTMRLTMTPAAVKGVGKTLKKIIGR